jgi:hypothetical protein
VAAVAAAVSVSDYAATYADRWTRAYENVLASVVWDRPEAAASAENGHAVADVY